MARRRQGFSADIASAISNAAARYRLDPAALRTFANIESSGNPRASNGSFSGLFGLSAREFQRGGGRGDIFDPVQNSMAAAANLAAKRIQLEQSLGRPPTTTELYMAHQQGMGGFQAHMANPDRPAWQNMAGTAEGRRRGEGWARQAIVGNIPASFRHLGENITSQQFMDAWRQRIEGTMTPATGPTPVSNEPATPRSVGMNPLGTPTEMPEAGTMTPDYEAGIAVAPYREPQPWGPSQAPPSIPDMATPPPIVAGIGGGGLNIGAALSAAGKAISASSQIRLPALTDLSQSLGPEPTWPSIPARPRRQFGPQRGSGHA